MQQRFQHPFYDSNNPSQTKTPQNHHSQYESQIDSPQIDQRTPKCITQRNSQIVSNNTLSPYLRNIIIDEQQLNQQLENTPSEITQYVQQKAKQIPYIQQNFSGGNIISSQQQQAKESVILNNHSSNSRTYNQTQQNFRSAQLTNNHNQFLGIENDNPLEIRNDRQVISNSVNDKHQHEINYSNSNMNNPLNNYMIGNQMKQGNKDEQSNNYYIISSLQSTSQNGSVDVSQYGNTADNKYPYQYNIQSGYSSKLQNDLQLNQIKNIEQENLLTQMQEKIKFLTTENEEQKKKIRNFNQQVQNGGGKSQTTPLYEKFNTISNQIESLSNSQLKLDLKKLNTQNSIQFRIDSSRSQITKSEFDQIPKESIQIENLEKQRKNQSKSRQKSKNHHRHKKNSSNKKKRNRSSSNSSITSSSNSSNYSGSSRNQSSSSSHSSVDSDQDYGKYIKKNYNKVKETKENINSKREEILQDRSKNRSASKREKSKSKHSKQKTEDEILKLGSLLIKEVNLNRKLRDLFMNTIGSTEQFRRMLVEKKFTNAFLGVLKVFLDVLTIMSFSKKSSSPPAHSPSSYSPMNQLANTSTFTTQSNFQQRNPILSQSRFNIPSHLQLKYLEPQSQRFINQNYQSPQNGYIGPYITERIYSQHSNGQHSPLTSHSFISVKQGNQHFPASVSQRDYSPLDHGLNGTNNQQTSNIYYQMHGQNQQLRQRANTNNNRNHINDLNISNINRKTSSHNVNSQSITGQNSGSDTYRQHFDSFNHPSPSIIQNKQVYQSQNDIQKFVSSPYFNQANSSTKKQLQDEGIKIQQHYMKKLNNENDWNENSIQDENEQFEEIQSQNNLRSMSNNRTQKNNQDKSKEQQLQQIKNKQTQFQEERSYQIPNKQNYQYDESEQSQNILISKQNSLKSQNSQIILNQKSYQNLSQKSNANHEIQSQSRNKSRSTSPYNQINQDQNQKQQNNVRQASQRNQANNIKQTENTLNVQRAQNKSINHVISPRSAISQLKNSNMYQISSSVPEIEMDSDSQEVTQQSNKQNQTLKKQQKTNKNDKLAASTKNKSSNRSFVFDDDQLSSQSTQNNKQKHVGFTPKQTTPRDRDKKSSHPPAIGLMPCMKSVRASYNGSITPSKASIVNIKADLSSKESHTNLDNSFYSNKNQSTHELHKPIKQSPIGIEFVGAKRKMQPESSKTRDFDIINGNTKQQQNQQNTLEQQQQQQQQQEKKTQNQNQLAQIKILDADPTTPNSQNKQNLYHTDNTQTPTLKPNGK
ncbi:hypothetical protein ABPG72_005271 [Tetrahymena utriculariae]